MVGFTCGQLRGRDSSWSRDVVGAVLLHQLSELPPEGHMNTSQRPVSDSLLKDPRHNLKPSPCGETEGIKDISVQDFNSHVKNIKELLITAKPVWMSMQFISQAWI